MVKNGGQLQMSHVGKFHLLTLFTREHWFQTFNNLFIS